MLLSRSKATDQYPRSSLSRFLAWADCDRTFCDNQVFELLRKSCGSVNLFVCSSHRRLPQSGPPYTCKAKIDGIKAKTLPHLENTRPAWKRSVAHPLVPDRKAKYLAVSAVIFQFCGVSHNQLIRRRSRKYFAFFSTDSRSNSIRTSITRFK
jgi:hypothetical protein